MTRLAALALLALGSVGACSRRTESGSPDRPRVSSVSTSTVSVPAYSATSGAAAAAEASVVRRDWRVAATGAPFALRVDRDALVYCDGRGARRLDLATGQETTISAPCPPDDPNTACSGIGAVIDVRTPGLGPSDIIDLADGPAVPLEGHVHDCASDGSTLLVGTGSTVLVVDGASGRAKVVARELADHVAIGPRWIAWTSGSSVCAKPR